MTAGEAPPLSATLARIFDENPPALIGLAVSGGGDSMALLHLAYQQWPERIRAVTVDHGLRAESAAEAENVAAYCRGIHVPHTTLHWQGPKPTGNLMDQARQARLHLIANWAARQGLSDVLLGHTADDQAETFVMNLGRAAGLDGLCGLRPEFVSEGLRFHRPLLSITRAELRTYLRAHGISWIEDPSNENDRFSRARARKAIAALAPLGVNAATLAQTARNLAAARAALQAELAHLVQAQVTECAGGLQISRPALDGLAEDMQRRFLIAALRWIGGVAHPPREAALSQLRARLTAGKGATLAGVRFAFGRNGLTIHREPRAMQGPVAQDAVWDSRWQIEGPPMAGAMLAALGPDGLRHCPDWQTLGPKGALIASPALWHKDRLIAAPLAGFGAQYRAKLSQGFAEFILSH